MRCSIVRRNCMKLSLSCRWRTRAVCTLCACVI